MAAAGVTVSGPGIDRPTTSAAVGLSAALTYANQRTRAGEVASFYVRDEDGRVVGRADSDGFGGVQVFGIDGAAAPARDASPSATLEREPVAPGSASEAQAVAGRRSRNRPAPNPKKEDEMAAEGKTSTATRRKTATARKKKEGEKGTDLLATLMHQVEERVGGVERVPNKSETYTRLQVGGKTFAYVFPPRRSGLAVKIPRQLASIEAQLPSGHGFHKVGWGLTRTITKASEAPKTAAALAVAASAVAAGTPAAE